MLLLVTALLLWNSREVSAGEYLTYGDFQYTYDAAEDSVCIRKYTGKEKAVTIPSEIGGKQVRYMGEVFSGNETLQKAVLPEGIRTVSGFDGCSSLKEVNIPESCTRIDYFAFAGCVKLQEVKLPNGLKEIGDYAFYNCRRLKEIRIPDSVKVLEQNAFCSCVRLEKVTLSKGLTCIEYEAFEGCKALLSVTIPNGVKVIEEKAFSSCTHLKKLTLPNTITSIRYCAFSHCGMKRITIPKNVTYIGTNAFWGCENLKKVTIKSSRIKKMGTQPFVSIHEKAVFDVPNKCIRKYKKMIGYITEHEHVFY